MSVEQLLKRSFRLRLLLQPLIDQARPDPAGANRNHAHAGPAKIEREASSQTDDPGFSTGIWEHATGAHKGVNRRNVDDDALVTFQLRNSVLCPRPHPLQITTTEPIPILSPPR